jgi:hypothetical protein
MLRAVHSGLPVVRVGRGNTEGFVPLHDPSFIGGSHRDEGSAMADGLLDEVRQPAAGR